MNIYEKQGYNACLQGLTLFDNPYHYILPDFIKKEITPESVDRNYKRFDWMRGFYMAKNKAMQEYCEGLEEIGYKKGRKENNRYFKECKSDELF